MEFFLRTEIRIHVVEQHPRLIPIIIRKLVLAKIEPNICALLSWGGSELGLYRFLHKLFLPLGFEWSVGGWN